MLMRDGVAEPFCDLCDALEDAREGVLDLDFDVDLGFDVDLAFEENLEADFPSASN